MVSFREYIGGQKFIHLRCDVRSRIGSRYNPFPVRCSHLASALSGDWSKYCRSVVVNVKFALLGSAAIPQNRVGFHTIVAIIFLFEIVSRSLSEAVCLDEAE
jgi:hypothetical protein